MMIGFIKAMCQCIFLLQFHIVEFRKEHSLNRGFFFSCQHTEADEDDWDISSVEEDILLMKDDRGQKGMTVQKNEPNGASVVHAWGLPKKSVPKEEGNIFISD